MKRLCVVLLGMVALASGCVSSGARYAEVKAQLGAPAPGQGRVFFFREAAFFGAAVQSDVLLNGTKVGTSMPGGFFYADVAAGNQVCSTQTEVTRTVTFTLESGETRYIKSSPGFGVLMGRVNLELASPADAEKLLEPLHYTGTPIPAKAEVKPAEKPAVPST